MNNMRFDNENSKCVSAKRNEWISVKDRLPVTFDEVLVHSDNCFISIAWRETEKRKNGIVGWHWNSYFKSLGHVTHWMPLPEPPGGDPMTKQQLVD